MGFMGKLLDSAVGLFPPQSAPELGLAMLRLYFSERQNHPLS